jgi:transcriptional regulator with XRE-family HTH domain
MSEHARRAKRRPVSGHGQRAAGAAHGSDDLGSRLAHLRPPVAGQSADVHSADDLGGRLARLRQMYGMSQRELARLSGMTNGTISLIEKNLTSPQVASLKKILAVFSMNMAAFFAMELEESDQVFFGKQELIEIGGGGISLRLVAGQKRSRRLQVVHEHFPPGSDTGKGMLRHEGEEAGVVVRGTLEVTAGRHKRVLGPGDAYHFSSTVPHRFRNIGDEVCEVVSAATPPSF